MSDARFELAGVSVSPRHDGGLVHVDASYWLSVTPDGGLLTDCTSCTITQHPAKPATPRRAA